MTEFTRYKRKIKEPIIIPYNVKNKLIRDVDLKEMMNDPVITTKDAGVMSDEVKQIFVDTEDDVKDALSYLKNYFNIIDQNDLKKAKVGKTTEVTIAPEEAYGPRDTKLIETMSVSKFRRLCPNAKGFVGEISSTKNSIFPDVICNLENIYRFKSESGIGKLANNLRTKTKNNIVIDNEVVFEFSGRENLSSLIGFPSTSSDRKKNTSNR